MRDVYHNSVEDSPIRLRIKAARRSRAAAGFAAIAFLTAIAGCLYRFWFRDKLFGMQSIILMGLVGIVLLNLGRVAKSKRMTELAILRFYRSPRFYGAVVSISAALVFLYALSIGPAAQMVHARTVVQATAPVVEQSTPAVPEFPKLTLTVVIVNGSRSSAILNQKTVQLGGMIEGTQLVEVRESSVVVELAGFRKTISRFALPEGNATSTKSKSLN